MHASFPFGGRRKRMTGHNKHAPLLSFSRSEAVAIPGTRVVIPNECEGSKISPCGRNDRPASGNESFCNCDTVSSRERKKNRSGARFKKPQEIKKPTAKPIAPKITVKSFWTAMG